MALNNLTVPTDDADEFQRILDAAYEKYQDSIENLTDAATDEIETAINRHDMALKEIVREYVADASQLAKDYHHMLRQAWSEYSDTEFPQFADDGLVDFDRVLWQTVHGVANTDYPGLKYRDVKTGSNKFGVTMDDLWPSMDNVDDAQQFIGDMISAALRAQTQRSIRRDPTKPHWARVPQGKSCAFCVMLASRGFAYASEEAAGGEGNKYHDDCHCRIIPSWGKQTITGYDPDKLLAMWKRSKEGGVNVNAALARMRRSYREELSDGVWETSEPWPEDEVVYPYEKVWEHIFDRHRFDATMPNKTHFPQDWSAEKIKWAVREAVCAPDDISTANDGMKQHRRKMIGEIYVEVYLKKRRRAKGRFGVESAYPMSEQQRRRLGK